MGLFRGWCLKVCFSLKIKLESLLKSNAKHQKTLSFCTKFVCDKKCVLLLYFRTLQGSTYIFSKSFLFSVFENFFTINQGIDFSVRFQIYFYTIHETPPKV
uniref:Uncharacterized protein n=1 Tax=Cacopsylla melanoneura TaxID=428564 RepID=A0A8D8ZJF5_9HEMI